MQQIVVFDTTLRDGEQSPGCSLTPEEKLRLAMQLDTLGVDVIEAGFPISSPADAGAVRQIARAVRRPIIAALARAKDEDIDEAAAALEGAERSRIHTFIATSDLHLQQKLRITREQCVERAVQAVERARRYSDDVEFSAEDATRSDLSFLCRVVEAVIAAGATTVNLPDTVGYAQPAEIRRMFRTLRDAVPGCRGVVLSAHCHDDLGLAVANSLAALDAGAGQVECTINGIGERAGNASLEEIVMALHTRRDLYPHTTGVETTEIYRTSRLLSHLTGVHPQPNKAIVGRNAFAHEAGIHQDGVTKDRATYEIIRPEAVGVHEPQLVLGKHSGRHALALRYNALGYTLDECELEHSYRLFKLLADRKKEILDEDLISILHHGALNDSPHQYRLRWLEVVCGTAEAKAHARVSVGESEREAMATGDGPLAAAFAALAAAAEHSIEVEDLSVRAVTPGSDAVGEVALRARVDGKTFIGRGASTDIVNSAARAYLQVLDKAAHARVLEAAAAERASYLWGV